MKKILVWALFIGLVAALPAAVETFARGQLFISAYAGFVPAKEGRWDVLYNLCFESAVSRDFSVGFAYSQKQSHAGQNQDRLPVPLPPAGAGPADRLTYADLTTRLFCLEGKYHFALARVRRLDLFCGAGFGLELNKDNSLVFTYADAQLLIEYVDKNRYYLVANFFAGGNYYLAGNLALSAKAGYQYSGISGYDPVFSLGIAFRIQ